MKKSIWVSILFVSNLFCAACGSLVYAAPPSEKPIKSTPVKTKEAAKTEAQKAEAPQKGKEEFWVNIFPIGISVSDLEIDPQDPNILYATTSNGLFKTSDGGKIWTLLSKFGESGFVEIDPISSKTMYWATKGKLWKSKDGGMNWEDITAGVISNINTIRINPKSPEIMYATTSGSLYKTLNGGKTWGKIAEGGASNVFLDPDVPDGVYANLGKGLYYSASGGQSFELLKEYNGIKYATVEKRRRTFPNENKIVEKEVIKECRGAKWPVIFNPLDSKKWVLKVCQDGDIVRSIDSGKTWEVVYKYNRDYQENYPIHMALDPEKDIIYLVLIQYKNNRGVEQCKFVKSTDGGKTWTELPMPLSINITDLKISPSSNTIHVATSDHGIYKTTNEGESWESASFGLPTKMSGNKLKWIDTKSGVIYVSSGSGYWTSDNQGISWKWQSFLKQHDNRDWNQPQESESTQIFTTPDKAMWELFWEQLGIGIHWHLFKTIPGQKPTEIKTPSVPPRYVAVSPSNSQILYAFAPNAIKYGEHGIQGNILLKSEDAGFSWTEIKGPWANISMLYVDPQIPDIVYAVVNDNSIRIKTSDGGKTWTDITQGLRQTTEATWTSSKWLNPKDIPTVANIMLSVPTSFVIDPSNSNILYLSTYSGGVFRSEDGGKTWKIRTPNMRQMISIFDQESAKQCKGQKNCKGTIQNIERLLDTIGVYKIAINPEDTKNIYISTRTVGIQRSFDRGDTWQLLPNRGILDDRVSRGLIISSDIVFAEGNNGIYKLMELPQ